MDELQLVSIVFGVFSFCGPQGVMNGESMLQHVPLNLGAHVRSSGFIDWLNSRWPEKEYRNLQLHVNPEDWFTTASYSEGAHAWFPASAAAEVVAEELSRGVYTNVATPITSSLFRACSLRDGGGCWVVNLTWALKYRFTALVKI